MNTPLAECVRGPGRPSLGDRHYKTVAVVYIEAGRVNEPPTNAVARYFKVSKSCAAKWIYRSRQKGFLPSTTRGVSTRPSKHYPARVEMHRSTPEYRHWYACNECLTPWPCEVSLAD